MNPRKKIPNKSELEQLQKLYKTDEKIGERLGGVPAYLIAYWRRKKNIPKYSMPKFSEKEILTLWERYGDDDKCGLELGISKAAFYNWRRRYNIREKPAFLKLEQLELNFPGLKTKHGNLSLYGKRSISQKIIAQKIELEEVSVGETVEIEPDLTVSQFYLGQIIEEFSKNSYDYIWNSNKIVLSLQAGLNKTESSHPDINKMVREFVRRHNINYFYDINKGNCHQIVLEKGLILPGQLGVGCDPNIVSYGSLSAYTAIISPKEMAELWGTGKAKLTVPPTLRIDINGRRHKSVSARDIALSIMEQLSIDDIQGKVFEYYGSVLSKMTVGERFTLTNQASAMGAKGAICHFDSTTRRFLNSRTQENYSPIIADKDAVYQGMYQINIDQLSPQIAGPNGNKSVKAVAEMEGLPVNMVILGSCSSGRFEDLRIGADILKGKKVNSDCRLLIVPGSQTVYLKALKKGLIRVFIESGAMVMNPGLPVRIPNLHQMMADGENCLATINGKYIAEIDNNSNKSVYICSPATAVASALQGAITDPTRFVG